MYDHFRFTLFIFSWLSCFSLWNSPERGIFLFLLAILLDSIQPIQQIWHLLLQLPTLSPLSLLFFLVLVF